MTIRDILKMGDARLLRVAKPVQEFDTPGLHALIADMRETMAAVLVAGMTPLPNAVWWRDAMLAPPLETVIIAAKPRLPADAAKRIRYR